MKFRTFQWRAVLLPAVVALAAIAGLGWYNFVTIPSRQRSLNERNLDSLRTLAAQVKSRVDNLDQAIDNAIDSYNGTNTADFGEFVKYFAPELSILQFARNATPKSGQKENLSGSIEGRLFNEASDPPLVKIQRDEGRTFLYLGYYHFDDNHVGTVVVARADIEELVSEYLPTESDFDALLLVDRGGSVMFQQSAIGLELAHVDRLRGQTSLVTNAGSDRARDTADSFESMRASSSIADKVLGDASYRLYIQPVKLSLAGSAEGDAEEWALCGLVRADHFRAASSEISYNVLLLFAVGLAAVCVSIPLVKLHILHPRERLRRSDRAWIAVSSFLTTALVTFWLLGIYQFGYVFPTLTDLNLEKAANEIARNLKDEVGKISEEMKTLKAPDLSTAIDRKRPKLVERKGGHAVCVPSWSCVTGLLWKLESDRLAESSHPIRTRESQIPYRYFDLNVWTDKDGEQRIKWTTGPGITPFLNIRDLKPSYFEDLRRARLFGEADSAVPQSGVSVFLSPNTGKRVTVFWKALNGRQARDLVGQALVATPLSIDQPVLPEAFQFAVMDSPGHVLFHSDPTRSLQANFIQDCENNRVLRSKILGRQDGVLTASYRARENRLYLKRLDLGPFDRPNSPWWLVVFQDKAVPWTLSGYTLTAAALMFSIYAMALAAIAAVVLLSNRKLATSWFWPDPRKAIRYRIVVLVNSIVAIIAIVGFYRVEPTAGLFWTAALCGIALLVSYAIVVWRHASPSERSGWCREFWCARASILLVTAAVPAVACFHLAYDFEARVMTRRGELQLARDLAARQLRIRRQAERVQLCKPKQRDDGDDECATATAFVEARITTSWDNLPLFDNGSGPPLPDTQDRRAPKLTDVLMRWVHWPINEFSIGLIAAAVDPGRRVSLDMSPGPVVIGMLIVALAFVLFAFQRYMLSPLYALELRPQAQFSADGASNPSPNVLLIGPPGSGKSTTLRNVPAMRVCDLRTLAYVERRRGTGPVMVERRTTRAAVAIMADTRWNEQRGPVASVSSPIAESLTWAESFDYSTVAQDPTAVLGIDHIEHRFDDPAFRGQLLRFLEELLYRHSRRVWIASAGDPLARLEDQRELDRWSRVLQSFRKQTVGIDREDVAERADCLAALIEERGAVINPGIRAMILEECVVTQQLVALAKDLVARFPDKQTLTVNDVRREIGDAAEPHYRAIWAACSTSEKLALRQLAEEDVINPKNQIVIRQLMRMGLMVRDQEFSLMNRTFRRFVLRAETADTIAVWEHEGLKVPWASIRTALLTVAIALVGLLFLAQQQVVGAWIGLVPTLAPAVPTVLKLVANTRSAKTATATA